MNKINWDLYFMSLCILISQRSIDKNTKHGCIFVGPDKSILSTGYNGPPANMNDENVPQSRPEKYSWFLHAEKNAILNAAKNGISLRNSTCYISGYSCSNCFLDLLNIGIDRVVFGPIGSNCVDDQTRILNHQLYNNQTEPRFKIDFMLNNLENKLELNKIFLDSLSYLERKFNAVS